MRGLAIAVLLVGCGLQEVGGGAGLDLPFLEVVYECDATTVAEPQALVELELCSDLDERELAASLDANGYEGATCWPTKRHAGPCRYRCPGRSMCNALNSCWCPPEDDEP